MSTRLNFLLTHFLSSTTDADLSSSLSYVISDLSQGGSRIFKDSDAAALSRWSIKVGSLVAAPQSRTSGFRLAALSLELSPALWATTAGLGGSASTNSASAKAWFDQAFRLVQKAETLQGCLPATATAAIDFLNVVFKKLSQHAEFAKQTIGSNTTTKLAGGLLDFCRDNAKAEPTSHAYRLLVTLLQTHGASLKSLGGQFQDTIMAEIEHPGAQDVLAHLPFCHGRAESSRQWKALAEQIACQIRYYALPPLTTTLQAQTQSSLHRILNNFGSLPLEAVTLPDGTPLQPSNFAQATRYIDRLSALTGALDVMLSSATERAMTCPTSALLGLAIYMISLAPTNQVSKRDDAVRNFEMGMLPQIHLKGARLALQLVSGLGAHIAEHDHEVLGALWQAAQIYPAHSRHRASVLAAYTVYFEKALVNFDEPTLEPVSHALLAQLAGLKKTSFIVSNQDTTKSAPTASQKAKYRQKLDDGLELNDIRPLDIDQDVLDAAEIACEGLARFATLPQCPDQSFALAARLALQLCLDPDFSLACTGHNLSGSTPRNSSRLIHVLDCRPELREGVLELLLALCSSPKSSRMPSLVNSATAVFSRAALSAERDIANLGRQGVQALQHTLHPSVPTLPVRGAHLDAELALDVGTSQDHATLAGSSSTALQAANINTQTNEESTGAIASISKGKQRAMDADDEVDPVTSSPPPEAPPAVDVAPSASALATDFQDSISGPLPADSAVAENGIARTKEGSPASASSGSKEGGVVKRRRRYSGDVSPGNILAGGQKKARTSISEDTKMLHKPSPASAPAAQAPGALVVKPHATSVSKGEKEATQSKNTASHNGQMSQGKRRVSNSMKGKTPAAASPSPSSASLRVLPFKQSEGQKEQPRQGQKKSKAGEDSVPPKRSSASPVAAAVPDKESTMLTADASDLPTPSSTGDFFKPPDIKENELAAEDLIDPSLLDKGASTGSPSRSTSAQTAAAADIAAGGDSEDDGPMPQIIDGLDSAGEEDAEGEEDTEMKA